MNHHAKRSNIRVGSTRPLTNNVIGRGIIRLNIIINRPMKSNTVLRPTCSLTHAFLPHRDGDGLQDRQNNTSHLINDGNHLRIHMPTKDIVGRKSNFLRLLYQVIHRLTLRPAGKLPTNIGITILLSAIMNHNVFGRSMTTPTATLPVNMRVFSITNKSGHRNLPLPCRNTRVIHGPSSVNRRTVQINGRVNICFLWGLTVLSTIHDHVVHHVNFISITITVKLNARGYIVKGLRDNLFNDQVNIRADAPLFLVVVVHPLC